MALESATYVSDLVTSNPAASDTVSQADDHLRMLKAVLKATFPNINAAVTATPYMLNQGTVPIGVICMWSGDPASLPTNWKLCDGTTVAKSDGSGNITLPDLRSRFIKGSGGTNASPSTAPTIGTTGGSATHTHTVTNTATSLTQAQLPNCTFTVTDPGHNHSVTDPGHVHGWGQATTTPGGGFASVSGASNTGYATATAVTGISIQNKVTGITVSSGGSGSTHNHTASVSTDNGEPPFYTLAYIMKV